MSFASPARRSLVVRVAPLAGESLFGYLERVARANVYSFSSWLFELVFSRFKDPRTLGSMAKIVGGEFDLQPLERLCELDTGTLMALTYRRVGHCHSRFGDHLVRTEALIPRRHRVCPKCVAEGTPRHRVLDIAFYTACARHGCCLIGECAKCGRPRFVNNKLSKRCETCDAPISFRARPADPTAVWLSRTLVLLEGGQKSAAGSFFSDLREITCALTDVVATEFCDEPGMVSNVAFERLSDAALECLSLRAGNFLRSETSFVHALQTHLDHHSGALPHLFVDFWLRGPDKFLAHSGNPSLRRIYSRWRATNPEPRTTESLKSEWDRRIGSQILKVDEIRRFLGLGLHWKSWLIRELDKEKGHFGRGKASTARSLDDFHGRLLESVKDSDAEPPFIPLKNLIHQRGFTRQPRRSVDRLLRAIRAGNVRVNWRANCRFGDIGIPVFFTAHLSPKVLEYSLEYQKKYLSDGLEVSTRTVSKFIDDKVIPATPFNDKDLIVLLDSVIEDFKARYLPVDSIGSIHQVSSLTLVGCLRKFGIFPAVNGIHENYFYMQTQVTDEVLDAIVASLAQVAESKQCRQVDEFYVARLLGISRAQLLPLVIEGVLTPVPSFKSGKKRAYFDLDEVSAYCNRYAKSLELMAIELARKKLCPKSGSDLSRVEFERRYLETNKIKVIDAGGGRYFVSKLEVEKYQDY